MSKERLEEIKTWLNRGFDLTEEDIEWLIEQADRGVEYDRYLISLEDNKHYVTGLEQQNKRYREALELLVKQETLGKDVKTGKTAISYNGMIALKGLGVFEDNEYIVYGADEVIESVLGEESK